MKRRYLVGGVVVLMLVAAYLSLPRAPRESKPESLAALAGEVGLAFPPGTRLLGIHRESGMDDLVKFKLEMRAQDVPSFLAAAGAEPGAMSAGNVAYFGPDRDFWDPRRARGFRGVQMRREQTFRTLNLGVAEEHDGLADVYIMEHGN